jgi:hypothetical protein
MEDLMRTRALPLLAVVPLMLPGELPPVSRAACAIAIELQVRAPLRWGTFEWHLVMGEAARVWAPYGVTICWGDADAACRGVEVKLRVLLAEDPPPPPRAAQGSPLGWIWFRGSDPGGEIVLSVSGARDLVSQARLGDRSLGSLPASVIERQLPAAVGRALAHEIGHFVLRDRRHARRGLMVSRFTPNQVTFAPAGTLRLPREETAWVRQTCGPVGAWAGGAAPGPVLPAPEPARATPYPR